MLHVSQLWSPAWGSLLARMLSFVGSAGDTLALPALLLCSAASADEKAAEEKEEAQEVVSGLTSGERRNLSCSLTTQAAVPITAGLA